MCVGVSEHLQFNVYARASVSSYMCMRICGYSCVYVCKCDVTVIYLCYVTGWIDMPLSVTTCVLCFRASTYLSLLVSCIYVCSYWAVMSLLQDTCGLPSF